MNFDVKQIEALLQMDCDKAILILELMRAASYADLEVTEKRAKRIEEEAERKRKRK